MNYVVGHSLILGRGGVKKRSGHIHQFWWWRQGYWQKAADPSCTEHSLSNKILSYYHVGIVHRQINWKDAFINALDGYFVLYPSFFNCSGLLLIVIFLRSTKWRQLTETFSASLYKMASFKHSKKKKTYIYIKAQVYVF